MPPGRGHGPSAPGILHAAPNQCSAAPRRAVSSRHGGGLHTRPRVAQTSGGAHEDRSRQGDRARRAARGPGTRSARQADGGRAARSSSKRGAGLGALIPDSAYADAGATDRLDRRAVRAVRRRSFASRSRSATRSKHLRSGQAVIGLLQPLLDPRSWSSSPKDGVTAISLDAIPRTLSRAQTMDALSLAGQRRRLQGGPHRRERVRALLPAPDDRRRARPSRPTS